MTAHHGREHGGAKLLTSQLKSEKKEDEELGFHNPLQAYIPSEGRLPTRHYS
jgi:hypothetical protein